MLDNHKKVSFIKKRNYIYIYRFSLKYIGQVLKNILVLMKVSYAFEQFVYIIKKLNY